MDGTTTKQEPEESFRSQPRILIPKLVQSRDKWKAKAGRRKKALKKEQVRSRDLGISRQRWKERAVAAEQQLQALQSQGQQAEEQLRLAQAEIDHLRLDLEKKAPR